jgi:hypothetical protein
MTGITELNAAEHAAAKALIQLAAIATNRRGVIMNDDELPIADNVIPQIRRIEEQPGLLGEINRHVADGNAWARYARARCGKANAAIAKLNVERGKAIPPLPAIPPVPLPELIAFIELPQDPAPEPGSDPSPADPSPTPPLPIEKPPNDTVDVKAVVTAFMEGKGEPPTPPKPRAKRQGGDGR